MTIPVRFPDAASLESVLAGLGPASADADLVPALARAFPGFEFSMARIDDAYWRDTRRTRLGAWPLDATPDQGEREIGTVAGRCGLPGRLRSMPTPRSTSMELTEVADREIDLPLTARP